LNRSDFAVDSNFILNPFKSFFENRAAFHFQNQAAFEIIATLLSSTVSFFDSSLWLMKLILDEI